MIKNYRFYIDCPYHEKDKCKNLGAYWDAEARRWYVPEGVAKEVFREWWPVEMLLKEQSKLPKHLRKSKTLTGARIAYIVKYVIGADKSLKYKTSRDLGRW